VTLDDDVERCDPSVRSLYFSERSTPSRSRGDSATTWTWIRKFSAQKHRSLNRYRSP